MQPVSSDSIVGDLCLFASVTQQTVLEAPVPRAQEQSCEEELGANPLGYTFELGVKFPFA